MRNTSVRAPSPSASAAEASSAFTFSGPTASGATTGTSPDISASRILRRAARQRVADLAERRHRHREQPVAVAEHRHRDVAERGAELGVDLGHRLADDLERLGEVRRRPPTNSTGIAAPLHLLRDLRAGAVHDADLVAFLDEAEDAVGRLAGDGAADLHDEAGDRRCEHGGALTSGTPR